jgi:hypothetical protein
MHSMRHFRPLPLPALSLCMVAAAALLSSPRVDAQDLHHIVPSNAFFVRHQVADPQLAFRDEYCEEILDAVLDAHFDDLIIETLELGGMQKAGSDQLRQLRDIVFKLVGSVDWQALTGQEWFLALDTMPSLPTWPVVVPSAIMGFRTDAADTPGLEKTLRKLLATVASFAPEELTFLTTKDPDTGSRRYTLAVTSWHDRPVIEMAFHDNDILFGVGQEFFGTALRMMETGSGESVVETDRYRKAFGELPVGNCTCMFFDVSGLMDEIQTSVMPLIPDYDQPRAIARELFKLGRVVDTVATRTHADGYSVVTESWTRFDEAAVANRNPMYLACTSAVTKSEFLEFVPADALSFRMTQGANLGPAYRHGLKLVQRFMPEKDSQQALVIWAAAQTLLDIDFEDDVLSLISAPSLMVTLPSENPTSLKPEDWVTLVKLKDPSSARSLMRRLTKTYDVAYPYIMEQLAIHKPNMALANMALPTIEISDAHGAFPGLKRFSASIRTPFMSLPMPEMYFGILGKMMVFTNSEFALAHVLEVGAGEADGITEHPALQGDRLPSGPLASASLIPYGRMMEQLQQSIQMAMGVMSMGLNLAAKQSPDPEVKFMVKAVAGIVPRVMIILQHVDYYDDGICYSQMKDEGRALYASASIGYLEPTQRPSYRRER